MELTIKCPKCSWKPDGESNWTCENCEYEWDVFKTAARCPRCSHQNEKTQCVVWKGGCDEISMHLEWYEGIDAGLKEVRIEKGKI